MPLRYRFRLRDLADTDDLIYATSVRNAENPYIQAPPRADGQELDPVSGRVTQSAMTVEVIDWWATFCIDPALLT